VGTLHATLFGYLVRTWDYIIIFVIIFMRCLNFVSNTYKVLLFLGFTGDNNKVKKWHIMLG
jgi:hypothetical protein